MSYRWCPVFRCKCMAQAEGLKFAGMKEDLQAKVVAQDAAIEKLTKAILRSRVGLKDQPPHRERLCFLGPTGVGKRIWPSSWLNICLVPAMRWYALIWANIWRNIRCPVWLERPRDMSAMRKADRLTEKVRRKPYSIVLLTKLKKLTRMCFNILLQVLDEGRSYWQLWQNDWL